MKLLPLIVASAMFAVLGLSAGATAQSLTLKIENGVVTLDADNVTVDEILARWTAATGLNVVSKSGRGSDVPLTIHLDGVSEHDALATVLKDLSGYIMGERRDPQTGLVTIDRLLILPESAAQAPPAPAAATPPRFAAGRRLGSFAPRVPTPAPVAEQGPDSDDPASPVEIAPGPGRDRQRANVVEGASGRLIGTGAGAVLDLTGAPEPNDDSGIDSAPPAASTKPSSPFGNAQGAARPGEPTPAPPRDVPPQVIRSMSEGGPPLPQTTPPPPAQAPPPKR